MQGELLRTLNLPKWNKLAVKKCLVRENEQDISDNGRVVRLYPNYTELSSFIILKHNYGQTNAPKVLKMALSGLLIIVAITV